MRPRDLLLVALLGCGGGGDSPPGIDGPPVTPPIDAPATAIDAPPTPPMIDANLEPPPPPVLGDQLHRAGRPLVKTLLLGSFGAAADQARLRETYDRATDPATWKSLALPTGVTLEREFATNLAVLDGFERGRTASITGAGCGNTFKYAGPASPQSYLFAADLFADDQIYVDTMTSNCSIYLDRELFLGSSQTLPATTCGGRTPIVDDVDMMYSVLTAGAFGIENTGRVPRLGDNVAAHGDVTTTFPFLGAPR